MKVKIVNKSHHPLPEYATDLSAGMDIRANLDELVELKPLERVLIPTGLFIALPEGYEAQIRPRSGLAIKHGITLLNTPGTIDADYRGEIKIIMINLSSENYIITDGERICQMIISPYTKVDLKLEETLDETERGAGGFGHTGMDELINSNTFTINLGDFKIYNGKTLSNIFVGKENGKIVREQSKIDEIEATNDVVNIIIPNDIYALNPSFLEEFFVNVAKKLGREDFWKKFKFIWGTNAPFITLHQAIDRILKNP
jgi:dUTP pyrophosphatase